jgi:polyhydroxybutyrate depolymerase
MLRAHPLALAVIAVVVSAAVGCAPDDAGEGEGEGEDIVFDDIDGSFVVDVDGRAATVFVPESYDGTAALPFVLLLHGYGIDGEDMVRFTNFQTAAETNNVIFASPSGNVDGNGSNFWNASPACCDFFGTDVDDSAFLRGVIDGARATANIDPARIFVIGHSNGGFMAHKLACEHSDVIAAVASLAGGIDALSCEPAQPVSVLQMHGTADTTIRIAGGTLAAGLPAYPSATTTIETWALLNSCDDAPVADASFDAALDLAGAETDVARFDNCAAGGHAELWTVNGGGHIVNGGDALVQRIVDFVLGHPR